MNTIDQGLNNLYLSLNVFKDVINAYVNSSNGGRYFSPESNLSMKEVTFKLDLIDSSGEILISYLGDKAKVIVK